MLCQESRTEGRQADGYGIIQRRKWPTHEEFVESTG